jgi:hypothetical protein
MHINIYYMNMETTDSDMNNNNMENELISFVCTALNIQAHELKEGTTIPRDMLISPEKYKKLKPHIATLKKIFSSKTMTSMHASAECSQKWPCINLVRQVMKRMGYDIRPERKCAGRDESGKKIFERFFKLYKRENFTVAVIPEEEEEEEEEEEYNS